MLAFLMAVVFQLQPQNVLPPREGGQDNHICGSPDICEQTGNSQYLEFLEGEREFTDVFEQLNYTSCGQAPACLY